MLRARQGILRAPAKASSPLPPAAGCAVGACQFAWAGAYNGTHGCAKCAPKLKTQDLSLSRQSCRACNGTDIGCDGDGGSTYTGEGTSKPQLLLARNLLPTINLLREMLPTRGVKGRSDGAAE